MAITFVNWGAFNATGGNANFVNAGGNVTPALPAHQEGDLIVLFCGNRDGTNATGFTSTGYVQITTFAGVTRVSMLAKRAASAAEANPTVVTGGAQLANDPTGVFVGVFRGVDLSDFDAGGTNRIPDELATATRDLATTTATTGHNFPALGDPGQNGSLFLVVSCSPNDYVGAPANAGGYTTFVNESILGNDISLVAAYQIQATSAAIGQGTFGGDTGNVGNSSLGEVVKEARPISFATIF